MNIAILSTLLCLATAVIVIIVSILIGKIPSEKKSKLEKDFDEAKNLDAKSKQSPIETVVEIVLSVKHSISMIPSYLVKTDLGSIYETSFPPNVGDKVSYDYQFKTWIKKE